MIRLSLIVTCLAISMMSIGCCAPMGCNSCGIGGCGSDGTIVRGGLAGGPLDGLRQMKRNMTCGNGCGETYFGDHANGRTGTLMPVNNDALYPFNGEEITAMPSVVFTQFLSDRFAVFGGKIDTMQSDFNEFAWGKGDEKFMNMGFGFNPVAALTSPYSTLGAGVMFAPDAESYLSLSVYDPNGDPTRSGFDSFFEDGVTVSAEGRIGTRFFD